MSWKITGVTLKPVLSYLEAPSAFGAWVGWILRAAAPALVVVGFSEADHFRPR